jgi:hypothetical protein
LKSLFQGSLEELVHQPDFRPLLRALFKDTLKSSLKSTFKLAEEVSIAFNLVVKGTFRLVDMLVNGHRDDGPQHCGHTACRLQAAAVPARTLRTSCDRHSMVKHATL